MVTPMPRSRSRRYSRRTDLSHPAPGTLSLIALVVASTGVSPPLMLAEYSVTNEALRMGRSTRYSHKLGFSNFVLARAYLAELRLEVRNCLSESVLTKSAPDNLSGATLSNRRRMKPVALPALHLSSPQI